MSSKMEELKPTTMLAYLEETVRASHGVGEVALCLPRPTPSPHFCQKKWPTSQGTDFFRSFSNTSASPDEQIATEKNPVQVTQGRNETVLEGWLRHQRHVLRLQRT